jgi:hypothetical protein
MWNVKEIDRDLSYRYGNPYLTGFPFIVFEVRQCDLATISDPVELEEDATLTCLDNCGVDYDDAETELVSVSPLTYHVTVWL